MSADEATTLIGEVRGLREDVRRGKLYQLLLALALIGVVVLGVLGTISYVLDAREKDKDRIAGRAGICGILNTYVIARDEAGVRALLVAAAQTPEQMAEKNKGKTQEQIDKEAADQARRLLLYVEGQDMKMVDGVVYAPRIDCAAYIKDPANPKFLPVPKSKPGAPPN
jgi:hypothetical protein